MKESYKEKITGNQLRELMPRIFKTFILVGSDPSNQKLVHKTRMNFIKKLMRETGETIPELAFDAIIDQYSKSSEFTDYHPASIAQYFNSLLYERSMG